MTEIMILTGPTFSSSELELAGQFRDEWSPGKRTLGFHSYVKSVRRLDAEPKVTLQWF